MPVSDPFYNNTLDILIFSHQNVTKMYVGVRLLAIQKHKHARLVERKVCFISDARNCGGIVAGICPKADPLSPQSGSESFYRQSWGGWYMQKQHSHLQLVISGLTSIILVVFRYS